MQSTHIICPLLDAREVQFGEFGGVVISLVVLL